MPSPGCHGGAVSLGIQADLSTTVVSSHALSYFLSISHIDLLLISPRAMLSLV